eukprot:2624576-Rhodomonas_salina.2
MELLGLRRVLSPPRRVLSPPLPPPTTPCRERRGKGPPPPSRRPTAGRRRSPPGAGTGDVSHWRERGATPSAASSCNSRRASDTDAVPRGSERDERKREVGLTHHVSHVTLHFLHAPHARVTVSGNASRRAALVTGRRGNGAQWRPRLVLVSAQAQSTSHPSGWDTQAARGCGPRVLRALYGKLCVPWPSMCQPHATPLCPHTRRRLSPLAQPRAIQDLHTPHARVSRRKELQERAAASWRGMRLVEASRIIMDSARWTCLVCSSIMMLRMMPAASFEARDSRAEGA